MTEALLKLSKKIKIKTVTSWKEDKDASIPSQREWEEMSAIQTEPEMQKQTSLCSCAYCSSAESLHHSITQQLLIALLCNRLGSESARDAEMQQDYICGGATKVNVMRAVV